MAWVQLLLSPNMPGMLGPEEGDKALERAAHDQGTLQLV